VETGKVLEFCSCLDRFTCESCHTCFSSACAYLSTVRCTDQPSNIGGVQGSVNVLRLT